MAETGSTAHTTCTSQVARYHSRHSEQPHTTFFTAVAQTEGRKRKDYVFWHQFDEKHKGAQVCTDTIPAESL